MMLALSVIAMIVAFFWGALIFGANMMTDAPTEKPPTFLAMWVWMAISAALFTCWWFGW